MNLFRYELKSIRTLPDTNLCLRIFPYEPFPLRTSAYELITCELFPLITITFSVNKFSVNNILHTNLIRYEPFPLRTIAVTNLIPTIRTLSQTNLCLRTLAYEPFPIRTLC